MNELADLHQFRHVGDALFQEILDGLDIVVGGLLNFLYPSGIRQIEPVQNAVQFCIGCFAKRWDFNDGWFQGQRLQPTDFDHYPKADQAIFAEYGSQGINFACIAAIDGGEVGECHGVNFQLFVMRRFYLQIIT